MEKVEDQMKTLVSCLNGLLAKGYSEDFKMSGGRLKMLSSGKTYEPNEVRVVNFYRFEGTSDPGDESILYVIETNDEKKGTLVDAYGPGSDTAVTTFMQKVEEIQKKV